MNTELVSEEQIDKVIEETKDIIPGRKLLDKMLETDKLNKPKITNEGARVALGELGSFDCATQEDIDEVFDKLNEIVFKMKKCMFRISFVNKGKRRFTAEMINEKKD